MKRHVRVVHGNEKPITCLICNQTFGQKGGLNRHVKAIHTNDKPFTCLICNQSFGLKLALNQHVKVVYEKEKRDTSVTFVTNLLESEHF